MPRTLQTYRKSTEGKVPRRVVPTQTEREALEAGAALSASIAAPPAAARAGAGSNNKPIVVDDGEESKTGVVPGEDTEMSVQEKETSPKSFGESADVLR
jgi:hypothetical protein